jgi:NO-binding membrane sensor protein with MHYT domain
LSLTCFEGVKSVIGKQPKYQIAGNPSQVEGVMRGIQGFYDYWLVALSVVIAILAAYAALDLSGRVTVTHGRARVAWLCGGAFAMGTGIWSMHYMGMEAFRLPVPVRYDWTTVPSCCSGSMGIGFSFLSW